MSKVKNQKDMKNYRKEYNSPKLQLLGKLSQATQGGQSTCTDGTHSTHKCN